MGFVPRDEVKKNDFQDKHVTINRQKHSYHQM
jgi:hypothetical protein